MRRCGLKCGRCGRDIEGPDEAHLFLHDAAPYHLEIAACGECGPEVGKRLQALEVGSAPNIFAWFPLARKILEASLRGDVSIHHRINKTSGGEAR